MKREFLTHAKAKESKIFKEGNFYRLIEDTINNKIFFEMSDLGAPCEGLKLLETGKFLRR
jgi:hypothetical protein